MPFKHKADRDAWREKNKEKIKQNDTVNKRKLRQDPKFRELEASYSRAYYKRNKERVRELQRQRKTAANPLYGIRGDFRSNNPERISHAVKRLRKLTDEIV